MSLCDACSKPGACCRSFLLIANGATLTSWDDEGEAGALSVAKGQGLPFVPNEKRETYLDESGRAYSAWNYRCPLLTESGRCGDYENRPQLCRDYEPGTDGLCVYFSRKETEE